MVSVFTEAFVQEYGSTRFMSSSYEGELQDDDEEAYYGADETVEPDLSVEGGRG